jgi:hypothetical protein
MPQRLNFIEEVYATGLAVVNHQAEAFCRQSNIKEAIIHLMGFCVLGLFDSIL